MTATPAVRHFWKLRYMATMNIEAEAQEKRDRHSQNKANKKSLIHK